MTPDEIIFPSRLVVIDAHRLFTDAVSLALSLTGDLRVVAAAQDAVDGLRAIEASRPDLIVTDYRLTGRVTGIDVARQVRDDEARNLRGTAVTPIVVLTAFPAPVVARHASEMECVTVLSKRSTMTDIVAALRCAVLRRGADPAVVTDPFALSPAELEVLEYLSSGLSASAIATELCLSVHAIRARIRGLLTKTDSTSQLEAVMKATRAGLVVPPAFDGALVEMAITA